MGTLVFGALLACEVRADITVLSKLGAMGSPNYQGSGAMGYVVTSSTEGLPGTAQFGMEWSGPALVTSVTITQAPDDSRQRFRYIRAYTSPTEWIEFELADTQGQQTITLDSPIFASQSYVMLVPQTRDMYPSMWYRDDIGKKNDHIVGIMDFSFAATTAGPDDVNVNLGATFSTSRAVDYNNNLSLLNDGNIISYETAQAVYWQSSNPGEIAVTASYGAPQSVASIGLGFAGDESSRACPRFVYVYANGDASNKIRLDLDGTYTQYGRYDLDTPFENITSLTVVLPDFSTDDWWYATTSQYVGLTEFQAFAPRVPEPATMTLLVLGGLAMLRRK